MALEFPNDTAVRANGRQMMLGEWLMVCPALEVRSMLTVTLRSATASAAGKGHLLVSHKLLADVRMQSLTKPCVQRTARRYWARLRVCAWCATPRKRLFAVCLHRARCARHHSSLAYTSRVKEIVQAVALPKAHLVCPNAGSPYYTVRRIRPLFLRLSSASQAPRPSVIAESPSR